MKFRAPDARGRIRTRPRYVLSDRPALIPLLTIVLRVLRPIWIIFVPVSACWRLLVTATE